jgi:hypothetical protein
VVVSLLNITSNLPLDFFYFQPFHKFLLFQSKNTLRNIWNWAQWNIRNGIYGIFGTNLLRNKWNDHFCPGIFGIASPGPFHPTIPQGINKNMEYSRDSGIFSMLPKYHMEFSEYILGIIHPEGILRTVIN